MTHARRRLPIFITALMTVLSGAVLAVGPGAAAHADTLTIPYCEQHELPNGVPIFQCWHIEIEDPFPVQFPCLRCPEVIQFRWPLEVPEIDVTVVAGGLLDGLRARLAAQAATDPKERDHYRAVARKKYSIAASHLGPIDLKVGDVWRNYNFKDATGDPEPQPALFERYGNEAILGVGLLRSALADPKNAGQLELLADAAFDRATIAFTKAFQS